MHMVYANTMTLKVRNRMLLAFFTTSLVFSILTIALFAYALINKKISSPDTLLRLVPLPDTKLLGYRQSATISAIISFELYTVLTAIFLFFHFEKTQALEVIYFCGFLIGCLCEGVRLFVPAYNFWHASSVQVLVTRIVIAGRILAPLGLLFSASFNDTEKRQYVERNFIIMILLAIMTGLLYPLQTFHINTGFTTGWGLRSLLLSIRIILILATLSILIYKGLLNNTAELIKQSIAYLILFIGYFLLCLADCYLLLILGVILQVGGTVFYLLSLHAYLWK
mgnify:CR=1 FL=1